MRSQICRYLVNGLLKIYLIGSLVLIFENRKKVQYHSTLLYCACCGKSISFLPCRAKPTYLLHCILCQIFSIQYDPYHVLSNLYSICIFTCMLSEIYTFPCNCANCEIIYLAFRVMKIQMTITIILVSRYSRYSRRSTALIF